MSVLEMLRGYTLREYAVVLAMAVLGSLGLVFMLNSMGGGATSGETLLKRETVVRDRTRLRCASWRRMLPPGRAPRRRLVRRARILAAAPGRCAAGSAPRKRCGSSPRARIHSHRDSHGAARPDTRADPCGQHLRPAGPTPRPQAAPAPKPTPKKSGSSGGGGGSFDDSG